MTWARSKENSLRFTIDQQTSHPSVKFYPLDIEMRVYGELGQDSLIVLEHRSSGESIDLDVGFKVVAVEYDPRIWLAAKATLVEGNHSDLSDALIFPNPNSGSFNVYLQDKRIDKVELFDLQGRLIAEQETTSRKNEVVPLNFQLQAGTYVLRVYSGEELRVFRLLSH